MQKFNTEQIIKALECCKGEDIPCTECIYADFGQCQTYMANDALALITSQEQKIFELENRLKECENGYEGTLFLDKCKLHDAEEKIKKLTQKI